MQVETLLREFPGPRGGRRTVRSSKAHTGRGWGNDGPGGESLGTGARAGCGLLRFRNQSSGCQKSMELGGQGGHVGLRPVHPCTRR